jgi:GTP-binding protein Era
MEWKIMSETNFKSGFVTLIGRPNVGKSTLMNRLLGQKIAAVSPRPQTTRRRQLGILTRENFQIVFMDTPGIHRGSDKLDRYMNDTAQETILDADVVIWIVDASLSPQPEDELIADVIRQLPQIPTVILLLNKIDKLNEEAKQKQRSVYGSLLPEAELCEISALHGEGEDTFLSLVLDHLAEGPMYYDPEQVTDFYEREIAADLIRQSCLNMLRDEIPHGIAVRIDEYKARDNGQIYIHATILVIRDSHKGIVIGKGAEMLKKIGTYARKEIEDLVAAQVFLDLKVKVNKNWRDKPDMLDYLGYSTVR